MEIFIIKKLLIPTSIDGTDTPNLSCASPFIKELTFQITNPQRPLARLISDSHAFAGNGLIRYLDDPQS